MAESKIKSYTRRINGKQVRVKEGRRKSLGKKIAMVAGTGVGILGLGLAAKKLNKSIKQSPLNPKNMALGRQAKPDGIITPDSRTIKGLASNPTSQKNNSKFTLEDAEWKQERKQFLKNTKSQKRQETFERLESLVSQGDVKDNLKYLARAEKGNADTYSRKIAAKKLASNARKLRKEGKYN